MDEISKNFGNVNIDKYWKYLKQEKRRLQIFVCKAEDRKGHLLNKQETLKCLTLE